MTFLTNTILLICFNYFLIFVSNFLAGPMAFLTKHHFLICSNFFHFCFKLFSRTYGPFCKTSFHDLLHFFIFASNFLTGPMTFLTNTVLMICFNYFFLFVTKIFTGPMTFLTNTVLMICFNFFFHFCYKIFHRTYGFPDKTPLFDMLNFFSFLHQTF